MKTSTRYQCEFCGTEYSDKNKCKQCEENHKTNLKIVGKKYVSFKGDNIGYPTKIEVEFENGEIATYKRC